MDVVVPAPELAHRPVRAVRAGIALAAWVMVVVGAGCMSPPPEGIGLYNKTGVDLVYVYLEPNPSDRPGAAAPGEYEVMRLSSGVSETFVPIPAEDDCTVAPLEARRTDGTVVARLPARTCWDPVYRWILDEGDL